VDVDPTPYFIQIYDITQGPGTLLVLTGGGRLVCVTVGPFQSNIFHVYIAVIAPRTVPISNPV